MWKLLRAIKRFLLVESVQTFFILVAIALATTSIIYTYYNARHVRIEVDDGVQKEDVEFILERANDAAQFADTILSWLEGASVVVGVLIVVGGWMFRNSIQQQIQESQERLHEAIASSNRFVEQAQQGLENRQARIDELEHELREAQRALAQDLQHELSESVAANQERFETIQNNARDRFRVLSLQLLAEQQVRAHNIETALKTLQSALAIDPNDHASNYLLGYLHTSRQEIDQALKHLERALTVEPDFAPAIAAYGLALRRKGDKITEPERIAERNRLWAQAEDKLLQALQMDYSLTDADGQSYYGTLGGLYRRQGRYQDALEAYEQAHEVTPDSSYPIINLAALHKHQGHDERADHFFQMVLEMAELTLDDDPRDVWTRCDYAQAKLVLGDLDGAIAQIKTVIGQNPGSGVLETVRNGLTFLQEAPRAIDGVDEMIAIIDAELSARRTAPGDRTGKDQDRSGVGTIQQND